MKITQAFFYTGIATFIRIISGFIISKIVAIYTGPAGLVIVGQFQNFITITQSFGAASIQAGIIKYIAESEDHYQKRIEILSTGLAIVLSFSTIVGIVILSSSSFLSNYFMGNDWYRIPIIFYSFSLILFNLNTFFVSIFQGEKSVKIYSIVNITSSISGLVLIVILVSMWDILGAIYALVTYQSMAFIVSIYYILKRKTFSFNFFKNLPQKTHFISLLKYGLMAIVSGIVGPASQLYVRQNIIDVAGIDSAGYWEAILKISGGFLMLITTTFSIYYLPNLSQAQTKKEFLSQLYHIMIFMVPCTIIMASGIYFFKEEVILIFFNDKFLPASELLGCQLIGDILKCISWGFAYIMLAKAMTKTFIATEVIFSFSFMALSFIFVNMFNTIGVVYAYCLNVTVYLFVSMGIFYKFIRRA